jgi:hypothetical protein
MINSSVLVERQEAAQKKPDETIQRQRRSLETNDTATLLAKERAAGNQAAIGISLNAGNSKPLPLVSSSLSNFGTDRMVGVSVALNQLERAVNRLDIQLSTLKDRRDDQQKINEDQRIVSSISENVGSVVDVFKGKGLHWLDLPSKSIWTNADLLSAAVHEKLREHDVLGAAHALQNFADEYRRVQTVLMEYINSTLGGSEFATTGLEVAAAAGAVAATIVTGGVAAGAGAGLLGTSLAVGAVAGVYGAAQEGAGQGGEMIAGMRSKFDFEKIAIRGGKDAIMGFVGTLAGGALSKYAANYFGRILMRRLTPDQVAMLAERLGVNAAELTPAAFLSKIQTFIIDFFSGAATTPLMSAIEVVLGKLEGKEAPSPEEFVKMVITNAIEGGLIQLFLAPLMHGSSRKPKSMDRSIVLEEPIPEAKLRSTAETTAELQSKVERTNTHEPIELPEVPIEMKLQSTAESTAELQASAATGERVDAVALSEKLPKAQLESSAETTRNLQAQAGEVVGTESPKALSEKPMSFRKTKAPGKPVKNPRKAELQQSGSATKKEVTPGSLYKSGKAHTTAYEEAPRRKTPNKELSKAERTSERERQLYDTYEWKERRKSADKLRRANPSKSNKPPIKVGDPDPAFPGQTITGVHEDHLVSANKIRKMEGFALLDAATQDQILNTPENLVLVSEKVNTSRGDTPYADYEGHKGEGLTVDPTWKKQMTIREAQIEALIRERIRQAVALRMRLNWRLRFGMPKGYEP